MLTVCAAVSSLHGSFFSLERHIIIAF
ncbi:rCG41195 [Rattus norvegicus]|uniref:RCG41195 n=1 Tax=Rattus norvegicus TaxID=10116 RepID=A6KMT1_RAT|nr:rCG41195 [Rattus norvegicus]